MRLYSSPTYGQTTYTEAEKLHNLRSQFFIESTTTLQELNLKKEKFESEIEEEVKALDDFKNQFPDIQFKIEQLIGIKVKRINSLTIKVRAINSLIVYFFKYKINYISYNY